MTKYQQLLLLPLILISIAYGAYAAVRAPVKLQSPVVKQRVSPAKPNYIIVDSCDEYNYGPKSHQGFCECYGDPYYYCAYFPKMTMRQSSNETYVEVSMPISYRDKDKHHGEYHIVYEQGR